ncbi:MAG TPA: type II toxin-antitoxin system prevent-host-death family antitoxin [Novosphingobium sp.]|nr:type II toxin-antitoxin system prevent-host-death family antitoxin [Novosphingobium sp.]
MLTVNMHDAKSRLSKLVAAVRCGDEPEVVIAVNGTPAARLVPIEAKPKPRWGLLKGKIKVPDSIDRDADEIVRAFEGLGD